MCDAGARGAQADAVGPRAGPDVVKVQEGPRRGALAGERRHRGGAREAVDVVKRLHQVARGLREAGSERRERRRVEPYDRSRVEVYVSFFGKWEVCVKNRFYAPRRVA